MKISVPHKWECSYNMPCHHLPQSLLTISLYAKIMGVLHAWERMFMGFMAPMIVNAIALPAISPNVIHRMMRPFPSYPRKQTEIQSAIRYRKHRRSLYATSHGFLKKWSGSWVLDNAWIVAVSNQCRYVWLTMYSCRTNRAVTKHNSSELDWRVSKSVSRYRTTQRHNKQDTERPNNWERCQLNVDLDMAVMMVAWYTIRPIWPCMVSKLRSFISVPMSLKRIQMALKPQHSWLEVC